MKFDRLRLAGFKSFSDPVDFVIQPGLTGVVGPNGCGKSNLVEALRWVMGETSYKNMRASGMEDVIFSGSGRRAARSHAEVGLVLNNKDRTAPAAFNDAEVLEVTRRIDRDSGSTYRVNGKEVRARDVQLLFADASSGARSPALVRQGQIGEIIGAKPQARRLILEEAAGVSGLHSRRHEAELRLKAAEDNLVRVDDVLRQVEGQIDSLKRQAKQSVRYRGLASDIRKLEALARLIGWREADRAHFEARQRLEKDTLDVAELTRAQGEAATAQAIAASELPARREAAARAGAALQRLISARDALEAEEKRAKQRAADLARSLAQWAHDLAREEALIGDAEATEQRLSAERDDLAAKNAGGEADKAEAIARREKADASLTEVEAALQQAQAAISDLNARRNAYGAALAEETRRHQRFEAEAAQLTRDHEALARNAPDPNERTRLQENERTLAEEVAKVEAQALAAERAVAEVREAENQARGPLAERDRTAQRLQTEVRTLEKLLGSGGGGLFPPVVESIGVARGYEAALGAALGDDLDASINTAAPAHWMQLEGLEADPALPAGVESLASFVNAPEPLQRRLKQIGVVLRGEGRTLAAQLRTGQRLVSREGDLWRWDGFVAAAEAPTPAARRLAEKNRLTDLSREAEAARQAVELARADFEGAQAKTKAAAAEDASLRQRLRDARSALDLGRLTLASFERRSGEAATRLSALEAGKTRAEAALQESAERKVAAEAKMAEVAPNQELSLALERARARSAEARAAATEARAQEHALARDLQARQARITAIANELASWGERSAKAKTHIEEIAGRRAEATKELEALDDTPVEFARQRRALFAELETAEAERKRLSDELSSAEIALADIDRAAKHALEAMAAAREARAASEQRLEGASERQEALLIAIRGELEVEPHELAPLAGVGFDDDLPERSVIERKLENLKSERERLGSVNLRADEELGEVEGGRDKLIAERDDLTEAIKKLRHAIGLLNGEGRERLLAAFSVVNGHFQQLFATLFAGGTAELQLVESDDPLQAGLEIFARPPGKKPQTLTLLSGGEQALTAMALIFAVFLTNPSPICVLDEVDAPLDDYNVERFCNLLEEMRKRSDTRFVTITHNPVTMARMDRLFGVTMAEQGVSQIVSVDLTTAESYREAS